MGDFAQQSVAASLPVGRLGFVTFYLNYRYGEMPYTLGTLTKIPLKGTSLTRQ
jgi:hypothetical protein